MAENIDKKKALETALSQIEKQFGKGSVMKLGDYKAMEVEAIPTGALSLDMALGIGGLPRGRIIEIYGPQIADMVSSFVLWTLRRIPSKMEPILCARVNNATGYASFQISFVKSSLFILLFPHQIFCSIL